MAPPTRSERGQAVTAPCPCLASWSPTIASRVIRRAKVGARKATGGTVRSGVSRAGRVWVDWDEARGVEHLIAALAPEGGHAPGCGYTPGFVFMGPRDDGPPIVLTPADAPTEQAAGDSSVMAESAADLIGRLYKPEPWLNAPIAEESNGHANGHNGTAHPLATWSPGSPRQEWRTASEAMGPRVVREAAAVAQEPRNGHEAPVAAPAREPALCELPHVRVVLGPVRTVEELGRLFGAGHKGGRR